MQLLQQFVLPECVCALCLCLCLCLGFCLCLLFICVLYTLLLPLRLCFCFCSHFCSCFLSFRRFVLLAACVVVFVLFNVIASTLVHRHGHGHEARGLRHMATPATPFLLWYVCVFYTMDKLFFNISAADAICLGRKLDKRLGSLHGFALA